MKKLLLLLLAFTVSGAAASAADTKPVEDVFLRYWSAYSKKDFAKAAADILPSDLEDAKKEILPVFLAAQSQTNKDAQELVNAFFGRTVGKAREAMTGVDVYVGLNRVVAAGNPPLFEILKDATNTIIFVRTPDADNAEIHYQISLRGESDMDVEGLTRKNGRWWVRVKDDPKEVAAQFKAMFAPQS